MSIHCLGPNPLIQAEIPIENQTTPVISVSGDVVANYSYFNTRVTNICCEINFANDIQPGIYLAQIHPSLAPLLPIYYHCLAFDPGNPINNTPMMITLSHNGTIAATSWDLLPASTSIVQINITYPYTPGG
jgi:hypothetical protein